MVTLEAVASSRAFMVTLEAVASAFLVVPAMPANAQIDHWTTDITAASVRFGLPEKWIRRVMSVESSGQTFVNGRPTISRAGAMGLMQLMPGTWAEMRLMLGLGGDPFEPHDNIMAGTAYLRMMYDRFGYPGLFAAYNAGPGRYAGHLVRGTRLPGETRRYLAKTTSHDSTVRLADERRGPRALFAENRFSNALTFAQGISNDLFAINDRSAN